VTFGKIYLLGTMVSGQKLLLKQERSFAEYLANYFKEPGQYEFDETTEEFISQAKKFNDLGYYCEHPLRSKDYINYWDDQKQK